MRGFFGRRKANPSKQKAEEDRRTAEAEDEQEKTEEHALREVPSEQNEHALSEAPPPDIQNHHSVEQDAGVEEGPAIGIDLGTTYSCVGVVRNGRVEIIQNEHNNRITPSCVAFDEHERYVGEGAIYHYHSTSDPTNTIFEVKRLIGRSFSDESVQSDLKLWPFKVFPGDQNQPLISVQFKGQEQQFAAEEISAMVLSKMKEVAEAFVGRPITKAVVTVPAYFTDSQRQATMDAGKIARLDVMLILNEPAAAALAYSLDKKDECRVGEKRSILIFDLGGGTFDVSLLELDSHGVLKTKAKAGDTHLGGADFTNRMVDHLADHFMKMHKKELQGKNDIRSNPKSMRKLKAECETAKLILSTNSSTKIEINGLFAGIDFKYGTITRARFEDLNKELFEKCMESLRQCLDDAKVSKESIDDVVLVGGATRMPKVQQLLKDFFPGKSLCTSINATETVAYGAALKAAELHPYTSQVGEEIELVDITPLSLGIESTGRVMTKVVPKNTRIPCTGEKVFYNEEHQTGVTIAVYEGEREMVKDNNFLGSFELDGIEAKPKWTVKIPVKFHIDANGILTVSARIEGSSREELITINKDRLPKEEIDRMIRRAERFKHEDEQRRKVADAKSALNEFVLRITSRANIGDKLSAADRNELDSAISSAQNWVKQESSSAEDLPELERLTAELKIWGRKL